MGYKVQSSFTGGELTPELHERNTLEKFRTGLKRARNVYVGKTGRIIGRQGLMFKKATKHSLTRASILYAPATLGGMVIEFGHLYMRVYDMNDEASIASPEEYTHNITEDDLADVHFTCKAHTLPGVGTFGHVCIFLNGQNVLQASLSLPGYDITITESLSNQSAGPVLFANTTTGTGYAVDYVFTTVTTGVESIQSAKFTDSFPQAVGEQNSMTVTTGDVDEMRVYRRPASGGAYGYIGSAYEVTANKMTFIDNGVEADYTHSPPEHTSTFEDDSDAIALTVNGRNLNAKTGIFYQGRLIVSGGNNKEAIHASRIIPRLFNSIDFTRDYPLNAECGLTLKCGTDGGAYVERFLDIGSLVAFTSAGVYSNEKGALTPDNIAMIKRADYVIDDRVPPLAVPGGVFFVDRATNAVTLIRASEEYASFLGEDVSIFSNHLFEGKRVVSWAFCGGKIPLIVAVMDDGSLNSFTYERDQQMRAWTRHDTDGYFESIAKYKDSNGDERLICIVRRDNGRYLEVFPDRFFEDIKDQFCVDSGVSFSNILNDFTVTRATITVTPRTAEDFEGQLNLTSDQATFTVGSDQVASGAVYKVFDSKGVAHRLDFVSRVSDNRVIVQPVGAWDPTITEIEDLYLCYTTLTGLDHLNGVSVSILRDGYVEASPLNQDPNNQYDDIVVQSGECTLSEPGAIVHVGRPYVCDVETLNVDTLEQKPTQLESKICSRVFVTVYKSRGLYVAAYFPQDVDSLDELDTNAGMQSLERFFVREKSEQNDDLIGNRPKLPQNRKACVATPNDWDTGGRVCIRQVDPLAFEILSIIPDIDVERKG